MVNFVTSILGGEAPDPLYILALINMSRLRYEKRRPWQVLKKVDSSQIVQGGNTYTTSFNLPTDFVRYVGESSLSEGSVVLFTEPDNKVTLTECPMELLLYEKNNWGKFAVDYGSRTFNICGLSPNQFNIYQYYIADFGDITLSTTWLRFNAYNPNFALLLCFDAAARWRLGTDYDDVAAFNAEDNGKMANEIFASMSTWDTELSLSTVNSLNYRGGYQDPRSQGPRGVRATS